MKNFTKSIICALMLCGMSVFTASAQFKPELNFGLLMHSYVQAQQQGYGATATPEYDSEYSYGVGIQRMRVLFDAKLSDKDYIFVETEINAALGTGGDKAASIRILDAQYDHKFNDAFTLSAGKILVAYNRNNLQGAATLLANDFGTFQCEWNGVLACDAGRDIGVNLGGGFLENKLRYSIGAFMGSTFTDADGDSYLNSPLRFVGRLQYSFYDCDKYAGTNLGEGKTFTIGGGFDTQGEYVGGGVDAYLDMPVGKLGSLTANVAYSSMTGGSASEKYYVAIPSKDVYFAELGYYFKDVKLQPWVKYELMSERNGGMDDTVYGGGLSYYFNGYNTNVKLAYTARENSILNKTYSQVQLQLQLFIF